MKRVGIMVVAFVLLLSVGLKAGQIEDFFKAVDYRQYQKASDLLAQIADADEKKRFYQGYLQLKMGDAQAAEKLFKDALATSPKEGLYYAGLGYAALQLGKTSESEVYMEKALQLGKNKNADLLSLVAEAYLAHSIALPAAMDLVTKAIALQPQNARQLILRGDIYLKLLDGGKAISDFEAAWEKDKTNGVPHHKIGNVYLNIKNIPRAEEAFKLSASSDPTYPAVYKDMAELAFTKKDLASAVAHYEKYISLSEITRNDIKGRYGYFCYLNKAYDKAVEIFQQIISEESDNMLIYKYLAYALSELENKEKAVIAFDEYFQKATADKRDWKDYEVYGKLLLGLGKAPEAISALKQAADMNPTSAELTQYVAETAFKLKEYPVAVEQYSKLIALRKAPFPQDYYILGRSYFSMNQYQSADSAFTKLIELQPQSHIAQLWKARAMANLDPETEQGLAKASYEKVIELVPAGEDKYKADLIEANAYLGYYYYLKQQYDSSATYWKQVALLDPTNEQAKEALSALAN